MDERGRLGSVDTTASTGSGGDVLVLKKGLVDEAPMADSAASTARTEATEAADRVGACRSWIFDFDSTVIKHESLELMLAELLNDDPQASALLAHLGVPPTYRGATSALLAAAEAELHAKAFRSALLFYERAHLYDPKSADIPAFIAATRELLGGEE